MHQLCGCMMPTGLRRLIEVVEPAYWWEVSSANRVTALGLARYPAPLSPTVDPYCTWQWAAEIRRSRPSLTDSSICLNEEV